MASSGPGTSSTHPTEWGARRLRQHRALTRGPETPKPKQALVRGPCLGTVWGTLLYDSPLTGAGGLRRRFRFLRRRIHRQGHHLPGVHGRDGKWLAGDQARPFSGRSPVLLRRFGRWIVPEEV